MNQFKNIWISVSIILLMFTAYAKAAGPAQTIRIVLPSNAGSIAQRASQILAREITERSGAKVSTEGKADFTIELAVEPGIGAEGFTIADSKNSSVKITGNDENGLLYGVGKFLHTSRYDQKGFTPGKWHGKDIPKGEMRGMYFATHFNNWYEAASDEERLRYVESLALWGINSLVVHYPNQWFTGLDDPKSIAWFRKIKLLLNDAKTVGMRIGILQCPNAGFTSAPKEFLATPSKRCWGHMLCPSKPAARKLLLTNWEELLGQFSDTGLNFVVYWPYDEGGCACDQCALWGANAYPKLSKEFASIARTKFPKAQNIVSTWFFDKDPNDPVNILFLKDGEYAGLDKYLQENPGWADYIMTDAHRSFPDYPLKVGIPDGLPMINFPEISMWGQFPWGGYGANPMPERFQNLWKEVKGKISGGFPYSEGIYEDINKVIYSQFYWNAGKPAMETVKEYIAYEYSPAVVDEVAKAITLLEQNHDRQHITASASEAFALIEKADAKLSPQARQSWRWRMLYVRAQIDKELFRTGGKLEGPVLKAAFDEVIRISHAENSLEWVHPPKINDPNAEGKPVPKALYY
jgi:hypothetical protein